MGRKGSGSGAYEECSECGEKISLIYMRTHKKKPACLAKANERRARESGLFPVSNGSLAWRACRYAHNTLGAAFVGELIFTDYTQGRFQRPEERKTTNWLPRWIANMFDRDYELSRGIDAPEKEYGVVVARALRDPEYKASLQVAFQLQGYQAVRAFVETPAMRAKKKLIAAREARDRADALEAEARELAPELFNGH